MALDTPKKKLEYFWMYYKLPFLVITGILIVLIYFGYAKLTEKEVAFQALLFDIHTDVSEETLEEEFAAYAGIDTGKEDVLISTSLLLADGTSNYAMTSQSKFYSLIGTEDLDVALLLEENFESYSNADAFLDLREVFTDEELEQFPELYTDDTGAVIGVYCSDLPEIEEIGGYEDDVAVAGIAYNTQHAEAARLFLLYLLGE